MIPDLNKFHPKQLKTALSERLPLSTKLLLRRLLQRVTPRSTRARPFSFETPTLPSNFDLTALLAAGNKPERPPAGPIQTSIIIPVFNKAEFTFQCLSSLIHEVNLSENEIVVVDNASIDQTEAVLAHFANVVRVIRNEENRGFVDACNQGAAAAQGKYLLFLNNDTVVLPGWLDHLVDTIESNSSNGAVGSLFLYPDGLIQEAGSIVWKNGEAHHYGWRESPNDRRFIFSREVDYCSAASLLIRKEIFERLGGFDRRFVPAYYEDVDLCFGVRSLGYKVIYQPMSRVVHYEGATAGRDVTKGIKNFQITNREKFVDKWRAALESEHYDKNLNRIVQAANRKRGPVVLVFDERIPSPDRDAGSARMFMILSALVQWGHVIFVPFNRPQGIEYEQALWKEGVETADAEDYSQLLKRRDVKAAIVSRPTVAEALISRICRNKRIKIVFDMVDAYFIRLERESVVSGEAKKAEDARHYKKLETRLAQASDLVWCNSSEDKRVMEMAVPGKRIEVVTTIHEVHEANKSFAERRDLLFVGNLAHRPNLDSVHFLMREIDPLLREALPHAKIFIVGDHTTPEVQAYASERVKVTGYVPELEPLLKDCRVFIAPIRFGAGTKGKVGEAMSYGLPVVTTSIGAEGFKLENGVNAMIADTPESFAAAVVRLYSDESLWQSVSENSRLHVAGHFSFDVIAKTINNSIRETIGQ